jgi:hypothetical protein
MDPKVFQNDGRMWIRYKHKNIKIMQDTQSYYSTEYHKYFTCRIMRHF